MNLSVHAQNSNPCGKSWSEWRIAWNFSYGRVLYRLEFPSKSCGCGYSFVQIQHNFPGKANVMLRLEGPDCDGKTYAESFGAEIAGGTISNDRGDYHWFKSMPAVINVEVQFEQGDKKIRVVGGRSGTTTYINGMTEKEYNQKQQQNKTTTTTGNTTSGNSSTSPNKTSGSKSNTSSQYTNNTSRPGSSTQNAATGSTQPSAAEVERLRQQREAEQRRRDQEEAFRQQERRYQEQLQQITRNSEMRAQRDGAIMDGLGGIFSIIMANKAKKGLAEDAAERSSRIDEFKKKLAEGGYELVDCNSCNGEGYLNCGQCKSQGKIICSSCSGRAGSTCNRCGGSGKKSYGPYNLACTDCMGSGITKCLVCGNAGASVCFICHGRKQAQCYCAGTGKRLAVKKNVAAPVVTNNNYETSANETKPDPNRQLKLDLELDLAVIAGFNKIEKPNAVKKGIDSVYYIGFKRPYREDGDKGTLYLQLFTVYRYSDGSYPLMSDILEKSKYKIQSNRNGSTKLLGYFETLIAAKSALDNIAQNARKKGITVVQDAKPKKINPPTTTQSKADDFWNN